MHKMFKYLSLVLFSIVYIKSTEAIGNCGTQICTGTYLVDYYCCGVYSDLSCCYYHNYDYSKSIL